MSGPDEGLIEAAEGFVDELISRGQEIDDLRQLPQDLADRLAAAGFYRLCTPEALGGLGATPTTLGQVCEILATGNGSAAWCVFIGSTSQYTFVGLPERQLELMTADPNLLTSGVFAATGTATATSADPADGYVIDGTWTWGSGCHNAHWISGGVRVLDHEGEPATDTAGRPIDGRVYFRPDEIDIEDNWHTSGLRGSGSSTYHASALTVSADRLAGMGPPSPTADHPLYRFPQFPFLCLSIGTIALGMARASIEEVQRVAQEKTPAGARRTLAHRSSLHSSIAQADTKVRAARSLLYGEIDETWEVAQHDRPTLDHRRRLRSAIAHAVSVSVEAIDTMYTAVGGTSVFTESCLQRHFRDVHVATQHFMVAEPVFELAGRVMLGLDDKGIGL